MVHVVPPSGHKDFFAQLFSHDADSSKKIQKVLSEQF